jgi:multidrug efflux pump subunit AcrA (membrane-fusion protein)
MLSDHNPELLRSIKSDEMLPEISSWTRLGGLFLVGTIGAAILLASVIKYPITVKAPATVRPVGELRIIEATAEGTVKDIWVKENQVVPAGKAIATLDSSQLLTKKNQISGSIHQNKLQLLLIDAQIKTLRTQILAEANSTQRAIASAQFDLSRNEREYKDRQIISQTEVQEAEAGLELAQEEMKRYQQLGNTGAITSLQIKEKQQAFKAAEAKLRRAKVGINPSKSLVEIAQGRIAQESSRGKATQAALEKERENLTQRQIEIQSQINRDNHELAQIDTDLQKTIIRTLETGTILKLELRNPGQFVRPGQALAQIAPGSAPLVVKARVTSEDISKVLTCKVKVTECQNGKVQMQVSAYPYPDYGILKGVVRGITADAIKPQESIAVAASVAGNIAGAPYYEVTIEPEKFYLQKGDRSYQLLSGMEVTANIISKEETVLTFILRKARLLANM